MDDKTYIRLVYAHAESDGGHNHVDLLHQEPVLVVCPGLRVQSGMIWSRFYPIDVEQFSQLLHLLSAQTVDDAGLARILLYVLDYVSLGVGLVPYFII